MQITHASANRSVSDGKIASEIRSAGTATDATGTGMIMDMDMDMKAMTGATTGTTTTSGTTTIDMTRRFRKAVSGLAVASTLLLAPVIAAHAAGDESQESSMSTHAKSFGEAVKRDAKTVAAKCKEGAHRTAVAAKAVGHEVATAAKRGAAATRAAFRGEKPEAPAS
jgi:hypothetical protein